MKILVTGGNGFLGSWVTKALIKEGHEIRILHRENSDLSLLEGLMFESALGDVTDFSSVKSACQGVQGIFHIAAIIAYSPSERAKMQNVNIQGTENVVQAAIETKVQRLVHTSSVAAIGASPTPGTLLNENSPYEMGDYDIGYSETKRQGEEIVQSSARAGQLDAVIVNPTIVFGPGDALKGSRKLHLNVARGKIPFYPPGGVNVIDVEDAVHGHLQAFKQGRTGERYILGGSNILLKEMFALLAEMGGHKAPWIKIPSIGLKSIYHGCRFLEKRGYEPTIRSESLFLSTFYHWYDNSKARQELGLNPKPADHGIKRSIGWCKENGLL